MKLIVETWTIHRQALWLAVAAATLAGAMLTDEPLTALMYGVGAVTSVGNYFLGKRNAKVEIR